MKLQISPRLSLVIIAAMFVLPLLLAWLMYNGTIDFKPGSTRNLGELVQPAIPIDWSKGIETLHGDHDPTRPNPPDRIFLEHWVILYAVENPCTESCIESVTGIRQVHRASGRNQGRIRVALLLGDDSPAETTAAVRNVYPDFQLIRNPSGELWKTLKQVAGRAELPQPAAGNTYLIDPLGNIMMFYTAGSDPNFLKKDLKRLLTWSKLDD